VTQETKNERTTKADIIKMFADTRGRSLREAKGDVEAVLDLILSEVWAGKTVLLSGFGKFIIRANGGFERKGDMIRKSRRVCFVTSPTQRKVEE